MKFWTYWDFPISEKFLLAAEKLSHYSKNKMGIFHSSFARRWCLWTKPKAFANRSTNSKLNFSLRPHTGNNDDDFKRRNINFHWCDFKKRLFSVNNDTAAYRDEQAHRNLFACIFSFFFLSISFLFFPILTAFLSSHKSRRGSLAQHKKRWHMWWFVHNFSSHITILSKTLHDKSVNAEWKALLLA